MSNKVIPFLTFPTYPDEICIMMYPIDNEINIKPNSYIITNYGRVISLIQQDYPVEIRPNIRSYYAFANLLCTDTYRRAFQIHRLVMIYFNYIPNYKNMMVNHKNGVKSDNRLCNLEWVTNRENQIHAIRELHSLKASLSDDTVNKIRHDLKLGTGSYAEIAFKYNTTYHIVKSIAANSSNNYDYVPQDDSLDKKIYEESSKIPSSIVLQIYDELYNVLDDERASKMFNIPVYMIEAIRCIHPAFKDILNNKKPIKKDGRSRQILSEETAKEIYDKRMFGYFIRDLSKEYGVSDSIIEDISKCEGAFKYLKYKYGLEPICRRKNKIVTEEEALNAYNLCLTKCNKEVTELTGILSDQLINIKQCRGKFEYLKTKYGLEPQTLYKKVTAKYEKK